MYRNPTIKSALLQTPLGGDSSILISSCSVVYLSDMSNFGFGGTEFCKPLPLCRSFNKGVSLFTSLPSNKDSRVPQEFSFGNPAVFVDPWYSALHIGSLALSGDYWLRYSELIITHFGLVKLITRIRLPIDKTLLVCHDF